MPAPGEAAESNIQSPLEVSEADGTAPRQALASGEPGDSSVQTSPTSSSLMASCFMPSKKLDWIVRDTDRAPSFSFPTCRKPDHGL
ncbi:hypothetical protein MC885_007859 [Smutsia gigantea]|nr:hypothetical protein MC885_007859 [Smutsia gigantea]